MPAKKITAGIESISKGPKFEHNRDLELKNNFSREAEREELLLRYTLLHDTTAEKGLYLKNTAFNKKTHPLQHASPLICDASKHAARISYEKRTGKIPVTDHDGSPK